MKLPGVLHLEGQIQSLIKSSAKELGGFVSAFLTAHHSTIQSDLAALAQETSSRRSVLVHWEIAGIMVTHPTAHSTHHQGRDSILQVTVDPRIQLHCSNRGVGGFLIFLWHLPAQGRGGPTPRLSVPPNRLQHAEHMDSWEHCGAPRWAQQQGNTGQVTVYNHNTGVGIKERHHRKRGGSGKDCPPMDHTKMPFWCARPRTEQCSELQPGVVTTP